MASSDLWVERNWYDLVWPFSPDENLLRSLFEQMRKNCTDSQRHYHTLNHIADLLHLSAEYKDKLADSTVVNFSIFYHDTIYTPGSNQNEEKIAYVAETALSRLNIAPDKINLICSYILATKDHFSTQTNDTDLKYFLDFDLSILSKPRTEYEGYVRQVRKEYSILPEEQYKAGRIFFLKKLLQLPHVYFTEDFQSHEKQSKQNIEWEIGMLQQA